MILYTRNTNVNAELFLWKIMRKLSINIYSYTESSIYMCEIVMDLYCLGSIAVPSWYSQAKLSKCIFVACMTSMHIGNRIRNNCIFRLLIPHLSFRQIFVYVFGVKNCNDMLVEI